MLHSLQLIFNNMTALLRIEDRKELCIDQFSPNNIMYCSFLWRCKKIRIKVIHKKANIIISGKCNKLSIDNSGNKLMTLKEGHLLGKHVSSLNTQEKN